MIDEAALGGRLIVAPGAPEAAARAARCAGRLRAAGHLVEVCADLAEVALVATRSDHECAVIVLAEIERFRRAVAPLRTATLDPLPILVVGEMDPPQARDLMDVGVFHTVGDEREAGLLEAVVGRGVRYARALRREARFMDGARTLARRIGGSPAMTPLHGLVERAAIVDAPVLLIGEVGAGKRLVARAIHEASPRRGGPFVSWPVGAVAPEGVARVREALFGSAPVRGALESAQGGTLLVDEIALLPEPLQPALLDLLAVGAGPRATRADGSGRYRVDVRIIAGASIDLRHALNQGQLREDLYQRLKIFPIEIPPLRLRPVDIPVIADSLVDEYAARFGRPVVALSPEAVALLQAHDWPGNIRELQEHIERAVRRAAGPSLRPADLAELSHRLGTRATRGPMGTHDITLALDEALPLREVGRRAAAAAEIVAIRAALEENHGNVTHAARRLGVSRIHLQKRMKLYGLRQPPGGA